MHTVTPNTVTNSPLLQCIVMGIAMASNVGGMTSPISSPQNIFAIAVMADSSTPPNWLQWFAVALPVSIVTNLLIWLLLVAIYRPDQTVSEIMPLRSTPDPITATQVRPSLSCVRCGSRAPSLHANPIIQLSVWSKPSLLE
jgi:hypothetical protein